MYKYALLLRFGSLYAWIYPHQKAAAIRQYNPTKAKPSSQIDSPSKTINALTITAKARHASNIGVNTKDNMAPPNTYESRTSNGKSPNAICKELFMITLTA